MGSNNSHFFVRGHLTLSLSLSLSLSLWVGGWVGGGRRGMEGHNSIIILMVVAS